VSERVDIADAPRGYQLLGTGAPIAIVLGYPDGPAEPAPGDRLVPLAADPARAAGPASARPRVTVIGSGNYASQVLVPALAATPAVLRTIVSAGGVSATVAGRKHGFAQAATDPHAALADPDCDAVVIATRHDSHAGLVIEAVRRRKHVFVEKPLAITRAQLAELEAAVAASRAAGFDPIVMVGFNRRFAPQVVRLRELLAPVAEPRVMVMTVNAGDIPADHWTQSDAVGGGRIIGEGCHFVDLLRCLAGSPIRRTRAAMVGEAPGVAVREDKAVLTLEFANGSLGTVHYVASGHRSFPKERLEVFCRGAVLQLDNFRRLRGYGWPGFSRLDLWRQDKGNAACMAAFVAAVASGGPSPVAFDELVEVTRATFDAVDDMRAPA
jgi:predicted dehydrogenase